VAWNVLGIVSIETYPERTYDAFFPLSVYTYVVRLSGIMN